MAMTLDLAHLEELERMATGVPWDFKDLQPANKEFFLITSTAGVSMFDNPAVIFSTEESSFVVGHQAENAEFVCALRNAAPELLAELKQLREENAKLREWIEKNVRVQHGNGCIGITLPNGDCLCGADKKQRELSSLLGVGAK